MLEIEKTAIALGQKELAELARILTGQDKAKAFDFLKLSVYDKVTRAQRGK